MILAPSSTPTVADYVSCPAVVLASSGYKAVSIYGKYATDGRVADLLLNGLGVWALNCEHAANGWTGGYAAGVAHAVEHIAIYRHHQMDTIPIVYSVDTAVSVLTVPTCVNYFRGVASVHQGTGIEFGAYGGELAFDAAQAVGGTAFWGAAAGSWGGKTDPRCQVRQHPTSTLGSWSIDPDELLVPLPIWTGPHPAPVPQPPDAFPVPVPVSEDSMNLIQAFDGLVPDAAVYVVNGPFAEWVASGERVAELTILGASVDPATGNPHPTPRGGLKPLTLLGQEPIYGADYTGPRTSSADFAAHIG